MKHLSPTMAALSLALLIPDPSAGETRAALTSPPYVPPAITRSEPAKIIVELETREVKGNLAEDVQYTFWTFGGTVPGPFVRVRVGDTVQIRLKNDKGSRHAHSIDLHAVTGPGGGAAVSVVAAGVEKTSSGRP